MSKNTCARCKKLEALLKTLLYNVENVAIELDGIRQWLIHISEKISNMSYEEDR